MSPTAMIKFETEVKDKWTKILETQIEQASDEYKLVIKIINFKGCYKTISW
jgi:hypothetical protein